MYTKNRNHSSSILDYGKEKQHKNKNKYNHTKSSSFSTNKRIASSAAPLAIIPSLSSFYVGEINQDRKSNEMDSKSLRSKKEMRLAKKFTY